MTTPIRRHPALLAFACIAALLPGRPVQAEQDGLLTKDGKRLFPIGFYELPKDDAGLKAMAESGVNLVRIRNRADLDRAASVGMQCVLPLSIQAGATDKLRQLVESVQDHPALAVWEGPDEVVWNFTAFSGLHKKMKVHKTPGEWWRQTPEAVAYAEKRAQDLMPKMHEGIALVRKLDKHNRLFWINEALSSDVIYVRQYLDVVDVTGCDIYPVKKDARNVANVGLATERWKQAGRGKPVWMVLQAFAWSELGDYYGVKEVAYPTFAESRFMAYDVIARGAKGILYWGSHYLKSQAFRESIYALTSELSALQPFLVAPDVDGVRASVIEAYDTRALLGVRVTVRKAGDDWLIILVNEDDRPHMAVEVTGLTALNGRRIELLYDKET
ncbi:MAG: hypothetical protein JXQ73_07055, partial [Phycisphaerae bacterium]|nr:hypothetical protein [Phycisphaerae bacterium]